MSFLKNKVIKIMLITVALLVLTAVTTVCVTNGIVILSADEYVVSFDDACKIEGVDCIIILGAAVSEEGNMSRVLSDRVSMGIRLYKSGASSRILASGDHSRDNYNEVGAMKKYMIEQGVPENVIFTDHAGLDTYDSMYRARDIFKAKKVIIVTQQFHISRSVFIARSLGLDAYGVVSDENYRYYRPKTEVREIIARTKYVFDAVFKPKPKFLGEAIPIWGEASLSDG